MATAIEEVSSQALNGHTHRLEEAKPLKTSFELAQEIDEVLGIDRLTQKLNGLPAEIRIQKDAVQNAREMLTDAENDLKLAESVLTAQIASAIDPRTNKAVFSNDQARKAELAKLEATDPDYQGAFSRYREAQTAVNAAQFDLDRLMDEFVAARSVATLVASKLGLMSS